MLQLLLYRLSISSSCVRCTGRILFPGVLHFLCAVFRGDGGWQHYVRASNHLYVRVGHATEHADCCCASTLGISLVHWSCHPRGEPERPIVIALAPDCVVFCFVTRGVRMFLFDLNRRMQCSNGMLNNWATQKNYVVWSRIAMM